MTICESGGWKFTFKCESKHFKYKEHYEWKPKQSDRYCPGFYNDRDFFKKVLKYSYRVLMR